MRQELCTRIILIDRITCTYPTERKQVNFRCLLVNTEFLQRYILLRWKDMDTVLSWQSSLQHILKVPGERQRMATALGLSSMTLTRWANGESSPQRPHLMRLVQVVQPQYREELLEGLEVVYPDFQSWLKESSSEQIPSEFFAQLLDMRTTTMDALRFWRISDLILKQVLLN